MDDKTVNISPKILIWTGISATIIIITILVLNNYDNRRKFKQFKGLDNIIVNSDYPKRLNSLTHNFFPNDTVRIKSIKEHLGLLNRDYDEIDYSEIIIKGDSLFHTISSFQNYRKNLLIDNDIFLPKDVSNYIKYLDNNDKIDLKEKFLLTKDKYRIESMIKINDHSYLIIEQIR
jgi:hypothetical protein